MPIFLIFITDDGGIYKVWIVCKYKWNICRVHCTRHHSNKSSILNISLFRNYIYLRLHQLHNEKYYVQYRYVQYSITDHQRYFSLLKISVQYLVRWIDFFHFPNLFHQNQNVIYKLSCQFHLKNVCSIKKNFDLQFSTDLWVLEDPGHYLTVFKKISRRESVCQSVCDTNFVDDLTHKLLCRLGWNFI